MIMSILSIMCDTNTESPLMTQ